MTGSWEVVKTTGRIGTGNWHEFNVPLDQVFLAAKEWESCVKGKEKLWLCWNISDSWCLVQQKLVLEMGWTPVVGWDPNLIDSPPPLVDGAIMIDFNKSLNFPALWPHVPLEFAFLWTKKLAFWHADLLLDLPTLHKFVRMFESLTDGEMAAVLDKGGMRDALKFRQHRYWELLGCTTSKASLSQFELGCGWWRNFWAHPNVKSEQEREMRKKYYYDQGVGIMYWKKKYGGKVHNISNKEIKKGHFSEIGTVNYKKSCNKSKELELNYDLKKICMEMGLEGIV